MKNLYWDSLFKGSILQQMNDGVVALDSKGKIVALNNAAASLLGIETNEDDLTLASITIEEEGNDDFLQVLLDSVYEGTTIHNRIVNFVRQDGITLSLSVTASLVRDPSGKFEGAFLVLRDMTELEQLRANEHSLNHELKHALRSADENAKNLKAALGHGQKMRNWLTSAVIILFVGIGLFHWFGDTSVEAPTGTVASSGDDSEQTVITVTARPLTRSISLSGTVAPLEEVTLAAPFQGKVESKEFFYGDRVERGQILVVLGTADMEVALREARTGYIKARKNHLQLQGWDKTPEVAKVKRSLGQAKNQLKRAENKVTEDKELFEKGIIPRSEYDSSVQELRDKKMQYISSRENLQSVINKGDEEFLEISQMELDNAEAKVKAAEKKMAQAAIKAPVSGIAIRPSAKDKDARNVESGMSVSEGQSLLSIGSLEGLSITTEVDELDINSLETGQPVLVSGDAFPGIQLKGRISQISSQANEGQVPTFTTTIRLRDLPDDVEKKVRLGMTANMQVETYSNPEALMVPLSAVVQSSGTSVVFVQTTDGKVQEVKVETGGTTLTEVEILSGIKPGMTIFKTPIL